ncbi:hypothetical protein EMIHUDRAFT_232324 [Emiliania huxleyi CCMP1516]|uniref:Nucleotide-diphospho-sugar transferase domain-containing protein n=2 Tax=Emiliania huxleyi TaxID=2903 RepID=A0A0D3K566_EMIH1|nr:hypothetical protein EMIHUDRAFT_232324 [Emiliania huxleyi CCMP1516]EOD30901.1 hypothetical protein EMIHUDRAFT_232324 [Emiliania huxleyi CCMP1516]|eukprot:XP_005783330.1 hypothetical protein EMIHUDRAFT_232324 [Emiliania huxleyi CCMP1516]
MPWSKGLRRWVPDDAAPAAFQARITPAPVPRAQANRAPPCCRYCCCKPLPSGLGPCSGIGSAGVPSPILYRPRGKRHPSCLLLATVTLPGLQEAENRSSFTARQQGIIDMVRHFVERARAVAVEPTLIGVDSKMQTCIHLRAAGLPCRQDRLHGYCGVLHSRRRWAHPDADRSGDRTVAVDAKFWYALHYLRRGHIVFFADLDVAIAANPFERMSLQHSLQGLSDDLGAEDPSDPLRRNATRCGVDWYDAPACQSTGLWMAQPTQPAVKFFEHFLVKLQRSCEWEQSLFNRALGDMVPSTAPAMRWIDALNYAVWSKAEYANYGVATARRALQLPAGRVAVHFGYVPPSNKSEIMAAGICSLANQPAGAAYPGEAWTDAEARDAGCAVVSQSYLYVEGGGAVRLPDLTAVSRGVIVRFNSEISSLTLDRLATVSGPLSVRENPQLEVIKMGSLGTVRGGITVTGNVQLASLRLPHLASVGGYIDVSENGQSGAWLCELGEYAGSCSQQS